MKSLIAAASALAVAAIAVPAFAQDNLSLAPVTGYTNLGYAYADTNGLGFNTLDGRAGVLFGKYLGAEAEFKFGIGTTNTNVAGTDGKIQDAYAGYLVANLPVSPNFDVFARGGVGYTNYHLNSSGVTSEAGYPSWNYGAGAQYFLTAHDGLRVDYTRESFRDDAGHANVWGVAWVHRFR